jgi:hypothetical protein
MKVRFNAPTGPWLSGGAIWAITAASAILNAWGWQQSATGLVAGLLVTLVISSEILGVRLAMAVEAIARDRRWGRMAVTVALLAGVVAFNAYSGKAALHLVEAERLAPYQAAQAERAKVQADVTRIEAAIAAVPALPANAPATRLAAYQSARSAELARLEPQRSAAQARLDALPSVEAPAPPIAAEVLLGIVLLIEALKVAGLWAIAGGHSPAPAQPATNAGRDLANRRWKREAA